ncbi:glycosyltransferase [Robertmurraya beringensis]|uniref:Glycosyltransferase n=1 Tax=Robertmurraya beringensis TaxID=641660 RepID=A0ABV6KV25_9BACI
MNIMVFDVPAESGGALSVLTDFYKEVMTNQNSGVKWIFVVSKPILDETDNIKVLRFPWIKKSLLHRIFFDYLVAPLLLRIYKVNRVLSLQNVTVPFSNIPQTLFVHNAIPFSDIKFSFKENKYLWFYQNIIGKKIMKSISNADKVLVQTEWMKRACIRDTGISSEKVEVKFPEIKIEVKKTFEYNGASPLVFFYPASAVEFKNHRLILEACRKLRKKNYRVVLTLNGDENASIKEIYRIVKKENLPISFIGNLNRDEVFEYYTNSVLIFPSYIETVGLPLLEAKLHNCFILASDCSFAHDMLDSYDMAFYFNPFNPKELANQMDYIIDKCRNGFRL